jgi:hypothetical protein
VFFGHAWKLLGWRRGPNNVPGSRSLRLASNNMRRAQRRLALPEYVSRPAKTGTFRNSASNKEQPFSRLLLELENDG